MSLRLPPVLAGLLLLSGALLLAACADPPSDPDASSATRPPPDTDALAAALDTLAAAYPEATVAVAVRDPATGATLDRAPDRVFHAASTMKVPVLIELFRQAEVGRLNLDDSLLVANDFRSIVDGTPYQIGADADTALYARLGEAVPLRTLAERMTTHSSNLATNLLIAHVDADSVQRTIERLGARTMRVLRGVEDLPAYRAGLSNTATARDLAVLMQALMEGRAVGPAADRAMVDILLDQRHNAMIPAGLPAGARVAHKTGWITRIHHDAAIVYPPPDASAAAPYVLVILTEGLDDHAASAALGAAIARAVHDALRTSSDDGRAPNVEGRTPSAEY